LGATGGLVLAASRFVRSNANCRTAFPKSRKIFLLLSKFVGAGQISAEHIYALRSVMGGIYNKYRQEDAHEFMTALVDKCGSERNETSEGDKSSCSLSTTG
jgi:hypothetical protein